MAFVIRKFQDNKTVGDKLREMRKLENFTLAELAEKTKIHKKYLQAFEENDYQTLPEPIYTRNFLKTYVRALGGDVDYILQQYEEECSTCDYLKHARLPRKKTKPIQFLIANKYLRFAILGVFALLIVSYLGVQVHHIITPPDILVLSPPDGMVTEQAILTVNGKVDDGVIIKVNNEEVLLSKDGTFETEIALEKGLNVITVEGQKRYSRTTKTYRRVVLEQAAGTLGQR
jgi:transcriptional regulator with XRE-family HTH domain